METNEPRTKKLASLVVIGSGPVGMVSALLLKKHFDKVILLERQSKENFLQKHGFTFPIVFSPAAIKILERVGVWQSIQSEKSEFFGVVIHKRVFGREFEFTATRDGVYSHWRNHIIAMLYKRVCEEKIQVHFNANVEDIDFENNLCREAQLGDIPFDLLLGADGINSQTRRLLAKAHPDFAEDAFNLTFIDNWYAYRLPSKGALKEKFGGGDRFHASNVYLSNLAMFPEEKFRIISTSMKQPNEEINVLIKYGADITMPRLKLLNESFFGQYVESLPELETAWAAGIAGKFEQVQAPTFYLNHVLLVGDAAHGFESTGDLINIGIASIGSFYDLFIKNQSITAVLHEYDETAGEDLRFYARFSFRRSKEKIDAEVAQFEIGRVLRLTDRHPTMFGLFEENFEIGKYRRDLLKLKRLFYGTPLILGVILGVGLLTRGFLKAFLNRLDS